VLERKNRDNEASSSKDSEAGSYREMVCKQPKCRKYSSKCVSFVFTDIAIDIKERPQCLLCMQILSVGCMKLNKLKRDVVLKGCILSMSEIYLNFFIENKLSLVNKSRLLQK
jgi:hypothetical protein